MKIKLFVALEIQYFELGVFSFNSYVYYLTCGFIASTRTLNLLTRAFDLRTRAFNLPTHTFNLATPAFSLLTRGSEFVTHGYELITRGFELVTRGLEFVTRTLCFIFPHSHMFSSSDVKMAFCFAVINSFAAITLKTINEARAEFFRNHIFKMKMIDNFRW